MSEWMEGFEDGIEARRKGHSSFVCHGSHEYRKGFAEGWATEDVIIRTGA